MINLSLSELVVLYLLLALVVVGISWLRSLRIYRRERAEEERVHVHCHACGHLYTDHSNEELPRCPHCACPNERRRLPFV